jgi:superfamily II RNA helicase
VLVAAHTSAGKTVVAEYAFAMALRWEHSYKPGFFKLLHLK